jgi:hypothetical protein
VTSKDKNGTPLEVQIPAGAVNRNLARFIDPWGMSLRYTYVPAADTFPKVTSAGPDKEFGTADDILSQ